MRKVNAIAMEYEEFEEALIVATDGHAVIGVDSKRNWFYAVDDEYDAENVNKDLSKHLGVNIKAVRIDFTEDEDDVIIICD